MNLKGLKVIPLSVYRDASGSDCTNNGITSKTDTIYLVHAQGFLDAEQQPREQVFIEQTLGGEVSLVAVDKTRDNMVGPMFGGNLATTSDSRVRKIYRVHDRYETGRDYALLSM
jgi:hypothetical protein